MRTSRPHPRIHWVLPGAWLGLLLLSALLIWGFHHADEQGQIMAFYLVKLGVQPVGNMPWEYFEQMRPWFQPGVYYALLTPIHAIWGFHFEAFELITRLVQVAFAAAVLPLFARMVPAAATATDRWGRLYLASLWFVPSMLMRHTSESWCALLITASLYATWRLARDEGAARTIGIAAGGLAGLAFLARYQAGIFFAVLFTTIFWAVPELRRRAVWVGVGVAAALAVGLAVDAWGYGAVTLPYVNYFAHNVLAGRSSAFGEQPFYFYLVEVMIFLGNPLFWWWLALAGRATWREPFLRAVFLAVVGFVLVHSLIGHKEMRFLLPMLAPVALLLLALFARCSGSPSLARLSGARPWLLTIFTVVQCLALVIFTALFSTSERGHLEAAMWRLPQGSEVITATGLWAVPGARMPDEQAPPLDDVYLLEGDLTEQGGAWAWAFLFAKPPSMRMHLAPVAKLADVCETARPDALVLLTNRQEGSEEGDGDRFLDLDLPAVASFPPRWAPDGLYEHGLRFEIVACADFVRAVRGR